VKRLKLFFVPVLAIAAAFALMGCASTEVTGTVYFSLEDAPVEGAIIKVGDTEVTSDAYGHFSLGSMPLEIMEGQVVIEGFPDHDFSVDLEEADIEHHFTVEIPATHTEIVFVENTHDQAEISLDDVTVYFDGVEVDSRLLSPFQTGVVAPGNYAVSVDSEIYYPFTDVVVLEQGEQEIKLVLDITLEETYRRFNRTNDLHRHAESYNYLHPDVRALISEADWAGIHDTGVSIIDAAPNDETEYEDWVSQLTNRTYPAVVSFVRPYITEQGGDRTAREETQYWTNADGRWYRIFLERFW